eukprot:GCRY01000796.1.p1 GENE.GCRY01000796.1~~GCRY01000796.1.p1  ORF type:complete len:197 (-),score=53.14 GCRY01000796.1:73-663(-)
MSFAVRGVAGRLLKDKTVFFVCDIQERFRDVIHCMPAVIETSNYLVKSANHLQIPVFVTEQYPKALGHTVSELELPSTALIKEKKVFSMFPPLKDDLSQMPERKSVVIFGVETHVCVYQTTMDLIAEGYDVHIAADAVSSQRPYDREFALDRLRQVGANVTTSESLLFDLLHEAEGPVFKEVSKLSKVKRAAIARE